MPHTTMMTMMMMMVFVLPLASSCSSHHSRDYLTGYQDAQNDQVYKKHAFFNNGIDHFVTQPDYATGYKQGQQDAKKGISDEGC